MLAYNVDTNKVEEINDNWVLGGTHVLIGKEQAVWDFLKNHYPYDNAKIRSIKWFEDDEDCRVVVGFDLI